VPTARRFSAPFHDVLVARPDLDLHRASMAGRSSLESVRLMAARRRELVERVEEHLRTHGQPVEES
jgi:hypothetical protein